MIGIYKFTNKFDRKVYIGQSINIKDRYRGHKKAVNGGSQTHFHRAIRKYGFDNFDFHILIECPRENLNYWEKFYIKYYCSNNPNFGYNMTDGGENCNPSEETRKKISEAHKGKPTWCTGKKMSEEQKRNMRGPRPSIAGKNNPKYGTHSAPWNKGLTNIYSEETKCKISNGLKVYFREHPKPGVNAGKHRVYREDGTFYMSK